MATGDPREVRGAVAEQVQDSYLHYVGSGVQAPYDDGTMGETWGTLEKPCGIIRGMIEGRWAIAEVPRVQGGQYGVCLACVWRVPGITGGRGWHDQREGAPPINVDAPETKASQFASAVRPLSGPGGPQPNCKQYFDSVCLCPAHCGRVISPERDLLGTPAGPQAREGVEVTKYSIGNACGAPKY